MSNRSIRSSSRSFLYMKADMNLACIFLQDILMILPANSKHLFAINDSYFLVSLKDIRTFLFEILLSTTSLRFIPKLFLKHLIWKTSNFSWDLLSCPWFTASQQKIQRYSHINKVFWFYVNFFYLPEELKSSHRLVSFFSSWKNIIWIG